MKMVKVRLDFDNDIINNFGQDIKISFTAGGHYCIPISQTNQAIVDIDEDNNCGVSLVLLICLQNHTMKSFRLQESYIANLDMLVHQNYKK